MKTIQMDVPAKPSELNDWAKSKNFEMCQSTEMRIMPEGYWVVRENGHVRNGFVDEKDAIIHMLGLYVCEKLAEMQQAAASEQG